MCVHVSSSIGMKIYRQHLDNFNIVLKRATNFFVPSAELSGIAVQAKQVYTMAKLTETEYRVFAILRGTKVRSKKIDAITVRMNEFRQATEVIVLLFI